MNEAVREMTFDEEKQYYEKRVKEIFDNYKNPNGYEAPLHICVIRDSKRVIKKAEKEINRLQAENEQSQQLIKTKDIMITELNNACENIKSEAVKEFAERLVEERLAVVALKDKTDEYVDGYHDALCYVEEQVDDLKKEMVGES